MFGSMGIWSQLLRGIQSLCNCNEALAYTSASWWAVGFTRAALCLNFMNRISRIMVDLLASLGDDLQVIPLELMSPNLWRWFSVGEGGNAHSGLSAASNMLGSCPQL